MGGAFGSTTRIPDIRQRIHTFLTEHLRDCNKQFRHVRNSVYQPPELPLSGLFSYSIDQIFLEQLVSEISIQRDTSIDQLFHTKKVCIRSTVVNSNKQKTDVTSVEHRFHALCCEEETDKFVHFFEPNVIVHSLRHYRYFSDGTKGKLKQRAKNDILTWLKRTCNW